MLLGRLARANGSRAGFGMRGWRGRDGSLLQCFVKGLLWTLRRLACISVRHCCRGRVLRRPQRELLLSRLMWRPYETYRLQCIRKCGSCLNGACGWDRRSR